MTCILCDGHGYVWPCLYPEPFKSGIIRSEHVSRQFRQKPILCPSCEGKKEESSKEVRTRPSATPTPVAGPPPQMPPSTPPQQIPPQYPAQQPPAAAQPFVSEPPVAQTQVVAPPALSANVVPVYVPPAAPPMSPSTAYAPQPPTSSPVYGTSPLHQFSMENDGSFMLLPNDQRVEAELMKANMAPAKNGSGNMVLNLRWRTTWPQEYANVRIFDNITMTSDWAAKYQSLFRNCEGPQGQPLLSSDGLRYTGQAVQTGPQEWEFPDLIGNVVAFRTRQDETNTGREVNKIYGNYERATETQGMAVESSGNGAAVVQGPPQQVNWSP